MEQINKKIIFSIIGIVFLVFVFSMIFMIPNSINKITELNPFKIVDQIWEKAEWTEGANETFSGGTSTGDVSSLTTNLFNNVTNGFMRAVGISRGNGDSSSTFNVHVNQSGTNLATGVIGPFSGTSAIARYVNFTSADYSAALDEGAFTVEIYRTSGNIQFQRDPSSDFSGTLFSFYGQPHPATSGAVFTFTEVTPIFGNLTVDLLSPVDDTIFITNYVNFSANISDTGSLGISNVSLLINGIVNQTNSSGVAGIYNFSQTLAFGSYNWTVIAVDDTSNITSTATNTTLDFTVSPFNLNNMSYNSSAFETARQSFTANLTTISAEVPTNVVFWYDETSYSGTAAAAGDFITLTSEIGIPTISSEGNKTFNFTFDMTQGAQSSSQFNQSVNFTNMTICGAAPINTPYLNVTFKNETTDLEDITAALSTTLIYSLSSIGSINKTSTFSNTTENSFYTFCGYPVTDYTLDFSSTFSNSISQQRSFSTTYSFVNGSVTSQILYLLPDVLGLFQPFQIIDFVGDPISGVLSTITRTIGSSSVTVTSGVSDSSGFITFFLNPDFSYTGTFSKSGLTSVTSTFIPTTEIRIVTMGSGSGNIGNGTQILSNTTYIVEPKNSSLVNNTVYTFSLNVSSSQSINFISMNITDGDGTSYLYETDSSATYISNTLNTSLNKSFVGYFVVQTSTESFSFTKLWIVGNEFVGDYSLYRQASLFMVYGFDPFLRYLIVVVSILLVVIFLSKKEISDTSESKIIVALLMLWGFSIVGWVDTGFVSNTTKDEINLLAQYSSQFGIAIISTVFGAFFLLRRVFN